jgi:iron complex outermembrane receptor protein
MSLRHRRVHLTLVLTAAICSALQAVAADKDSAATESSDNSQTSERLEEIVVTGTLIRGVAATGAQVIGVSQQAVEESGASTTAQLLQTIPQLGSFNNLQYPAGGFGTQTTNRPNLRNLPGFTTSGSASTLVLLDGHRVVGMGVSTTSPDPDIVPPGMIDHVEIAANGGSAIYGSDAVAGTMNFITRKNFNGANADVRYGFADGYQSFDVDATFGHSWGRGSAYLSYNYSDHTALYGYDRSYVQQYPETVAGIPFPVTSLQCPGGNVQLLLSGGTVYALPYGPGTAKINTANQCNQAANTTIYPDEHRHSVMGGVSQELSDSIKLDVNGFYMNRDMYQALQQFATASYLGPAAFGLTPSPFMASHNITGSPIEIQQVSYAWGAPNGEKVDLSLDTWGITPTLTADLGAGWQLRALTSYGESRTESITSEPNLNALPLAIANGLFNPYAPDSSNPAGLSAVNSYEDFGLTRQKQFDGRLVADGDLFRLPGGAVKLAAGAEYIWEKFISQTGETVPGYENSGYPGLSIGGTLIAPPVAPLPVIDLGRHVEAAFGEINIPVFSRDNALPLLKELTLSASGRYDHYSDFGHTFNPQLGFTWKPMDWLKLRGNWGRSFVAPSLADNAKSAVTSFNWVQNLSLLFPPASLVANGTYPAPKPGQYVGVVLGNAPGIGPETAHTWSFGTDIEVPFVPGLQFSLSYYKIEFDNEIALPPFLNTATFYTYFGPYITVNPTQAQINAFLAQSNSIRGTPCVPQPGCLYAIQDDRKTNLGSYDVDGLDYTASYVHKTGFGSIDFALNGTYDLNILSSPAPGAPFADLVENNTSRLQLRASVGARIGALRAQAALNHTAGYQLDPPVGLNGQQTHVSSFDVVDLFFKYDLSGNVVFNNASATLGVYNVFNRDPPVFKEQNIVISMNGYTNGATIGRLIQIGVAKGF